jgi:hypothetical protein
MGPGNSATGNVVDYGRGSPNAGTWADWRAAALKGDITKQLATRNLCVPWECQVEKLKPTEKRKRRRAAAIAVLCLSDKQLDCIQGTSLEDIGVGIERFYRLMEMKERIRLRRILRGIRMRPSEKNVKNHIAKVYQVIEELEELGDSMGEHERGMVLLESVSIPIGDATLMGLGDRDISWTNVVSILLNGEKEQFVTISCNEQVKSDSSVSRGKARLESARGKVRLV